MYRSLPVIDVRIKRALIMIASKMLSLVVRYPLLRDLLERDIFRHINKVHHPICDALSKIGQKNL